MTKICFVLLAVLLAVDFVSYDAAAEQNIFASNDSGDSDAVSTRQEAQQKLDAMASLTSHFKISTGRSAGTGRGGDRLLDVNNNSNFSFYPSDLALSAVLIERMNARFGYCVNESSKTAGLGNVDKIKVVHMGGYVNRRINNGSRRRNRSWSLHSSGRALDIAAIEITVNGKKHDINMTKRSHDGGYGSAYSKFYRSFTACWDKYNRSRNARCGGAPVLDCKHNRLHHNHVHIAIPFCPRKPGIASS